MPTLTDVVTFVIGDKVRNTMRDREGVIRGFENEKLALVDYGQGPEKASVGNLVLLKPRPIPKIKKKCGQCGQEFEPNRAVAKYCSANCYQSFLDTRKVAADTLTWDAEGILARLFGFWAVRAKFYVDIRPEDQNLFENRYFALFGVIPEPKIGLYNISQDPQKWANEAEITFPVTDILPTALAELQTARLGKIARVQLFWMLMEHGFELTETQNIERIRAFVPEFQRTFFDAGVKGDN